MYLLLIWSQSWRLLTFFPLFTSSDENGEEEMNREAVNALLLLLKESRESELHRFQGPQIHNLPSSEGQKRARRDVPARKDLPHMDRRRAPCSVRSPFSLLSDSICAYLPSPQVASGWIQPWRCLWILRPGNIAFWSQLCGSMLSKGWPLQRHETACTGKGTRRVSTFSPKLIFAFFATPAKRAWHVN